MKKILSFSIIGCILAITFFSACNKKDTGVDRKTLLTTGSWKSYQGGMDDNGNGTWDASERHNIATTDVDTVVFMTDGTGNVSGNLSGLPVTIPFTWLLQNNDNDIRMITSSGGKADTSFNNIITLTTTDMLFRHSNSSPGSFTSYVKP